MRVQDIELNNNYPNLLFKRFEKTSPTTGYDVEYEYTNITFLELLDSDKSRYLVRYDSVVITKHKSNGPSKEDCGTGTHDVFLNGWEIIRNP